MGYMVTFTSTVTGGEDTRTVTFYNDGEAIGSPVAVSLGKANSVPIALSVGTHVITAVYNGTISSAPLTQVVQNVTVILTS